MLVDMMTDVVAHLLSFKCRIGSAPNAAGVADTDVFNEVLSESKADME